MNNTIHDTVQRQSAAKNNAAAMGTGSKGLQMPAVAAMQLKEKTVQKKGGPEEELPMQGKFISQLQGSETEEELPA